MSDVASATIWEVVSACIWAVLIPVTIDAMIEPLNIEVVRDRRPVRGTVKSLFP
jgi:hypothetical protein